VTFTSKKSQPAPPLGVVASITSGFDAVNKRLDLILLPLALDVFLWLGPHLSIKALFEQYFRFMESLLSTDAQMADSVQMLQAWKQVMMAVAERSNLFSRLSTMPLGVPSLMAARGGAVGPLGIPLTWSIDNVWLGLLCFSLFTLLGLLLGTFYFGGIAQQVRDARVNLSLLWREVWGGWARLTALAGMGVMLLFVMGAPLLVLSMIFAIISAELASLVFTLGTGVILWVMSFGALSVPGMFIQRRGLLGALWDSLRLVQSNLPQTAGLFVTAILLNLGLNMLWNLPPDDSWLLAVGLAGHALVSTALVAALFVFYKDRYRFWMETQQALQEQAARV
jgi:hypothetical protein